MFRAKQTLPVANY